MDVILNLIIRWKCNVYFNENDTFDGNRTISYIYQFSLTKNYDVSTAEYVGKYQVLFLMCTNSQVMECPKDLFFSRDGMKILLYRFKEELE